MNRPAPIVPERYRQPTIDFEPLRTLDKNAQERVLYVPDTHMRIWYNVQYDGYDMHHHDAAEVIICMAETYTVIANSKTYHMNVGDVLIIPPHMLHELKSNDGGARFICLFNIEVLNFSRDFKIMAPVFMDAYFCTAASKPDIYQQVYSSLISATEIYFSNVIMGELSIYSILLNVFSLIGRDYFKLSDSSSLNSSAEKPREHYERIAALLRYIDSNYMEDLTLEKAADYTGFSKYHFSRLFKQHTHTTFYDYLSRKRIQEAQYLLSTESNITDIAFRTGFNNLTTFCRCFKKVTNYSPSEYRSQLRPKQVHL